MDDKRYLKGAWLHHVTLLNFWPPFISQEWLKLELSNFVHGETISSSAKGMTDHPQKGHTYTQTRGDGI